MFCHIVAVIFFAWGTLVSKLSLTFSVAEPMVFHVHCFQFLDDVLVDNTKCSGVVHLHCCQRLGMTHEFESMAGRDGLSAVYVESAHLSLCCQGHDRLDYLCNCDDDSIVWWFSGVVGHEGNAHPPGCVSLIWRGTMHHCDPQGPCC
jgi:hypothetical protein